MTFCCRYRCRPVYECNECDYKDESELDWKRKCEEERQECLVEQKLMAEQGQDYVYWSTTVSYSCCLHCNNTVYKADTVINTVTLKDNCETEETSVCRKRIRTKRNKAKIETEFSYGSCCADDLALQPLRTKELEPSTCSRRQCIRTEFMSFAAWVTLPVGFQVFNFLIFFFKSFSTLAQMERRSRVVIAAR